MKKILTMIICVIMAAVMLAGCGAQKEPETQPAAQNDAAVAGTWTEPDFDSGYQFNEDGTGKDLFWDLSFTYTAVDGEIVITYDDDSYGKDKYSYTVDDSSLNMTRKDGQEKSFTYSRK